jgi:glycerophosphoryl diester phosphodiesterase
LLPPGTVNGISFPLAEQPVQGFSAIVEGREPGEYLAMPDNGFGAKATSRDFLIRAYWIHPDFKTAAGGSGAVNPDVANFIQFSDPDRLIGFTIVMENTPERWLTGGDIDPESLQVDRHGDLWVGDEFGPWILHFDAEGRLLEAPISLPGNLMSPNNPHLSGARPSQPNSRGLEGMGIDGRFLYPTLEGATQAELDVNATSTRRLMFEYDINKGEFTGRHWVYRVNPETPFLADVAPLDNKRLVIVERDGAPPPGAFGVHRRVYVVDLRHAKSGDELQKREVLNLAAIPDPDLVSLPAIRTGDVGLGDPFRVACESVEAIRVLSRDQVLVGCDNNFPNTGRNPGRADDNEFIVVDVPDLSDRR